MQPEFEKFIAKWQSIATRCGGFALPTRRDITASEFADYFPNMLIARWDFDAVEPTTLYIGSRIEAAWRQDPSQVPLQKVFKDPSTTKFHVEVARAVTSKQVAAFVEAELVFDDFQVLSIAQLRLPLSAEEGHPVIMSLFSLPDQQGQPGGALPTVQNMQHRFIDLKPKPELAAAI